MRNKALVALLGFAIFIAGGFAASAVNVDAPRDVYRLRDGVWTQQAGQLIEVGLDGCLVWENRRGVDVRRFPAPGLGPETCEEVVDPPTTTEPPPTTTEPPPPTTTEPPPPSTDGFIETFDNNTGEDRFDTGVFHRAANVYDKDEWVSTATWQADHDLSCGGADTSRTVSAWTNGQLDRGENLIYTCRDHMMTTMGDVDGYSIVWFSPKQTFTNATSVSWDVNVTDLKARQWFEVLLAPAGWDSGIPGCPGCTTQDWLAGTANVPGYPEGAVQVGNGPFGGDFHVHANGTSFNPAGWQGICGDWPLDPEGCASKAIRRTFTLTDNLNGTLTLDTHWGSYTFDGSFPAGGFNVVFKDHNYTPDKDGVPVGHTWHWDNIIIQ